MDLIVKLDIAFERVHFVIMLYIDWYYGIFGVCYQMIQSMDGFVIFIHISPA